MTQESVPASRERILDAAVRLVERTSVPFTMDQVAVEADVSRSTVYRRFKNVEGLRAALRSERAADFCMDEGGVRTRILDAALSEFTRTGVHGATIQGISELAGVSPMTVYNHFDDKEGLVAGLISGRGPSSLLTRDSVGCETFADTIAAFVAGALRLAQEQRDLFGLVIAPDPITRRAFQRIRGTTGDAGSAIESILADAELPEGVPPRVAASCLMGMIMANGVLRPMLFGDHVDDPDLLAEQITQLFVKAVS